MTKFRIYEIAKEINVDSKEIVSFLKGRNIAVKSNLSSVDEGVRQTVLKEMGRKGNGPKAPQKVQAPQQSSGQPKERVAPKAAPVHPAQPAQKDQQREDRRKEGHNQQGSQHGDHNGHGGESRRPDNRDRQNSGRMNQQNGQRTQHNGASTAHNDHNDRSRGSQQNHGRANGNGPRHNDNRDNRGGTSNNRRSQNNPRNNGGRPQNSGFNMNSPHAGKDMGKRNQNFGHKEKKEKIKGSYASRDTRPLRSADHMMKNHKHKNNNQAAPKKQAEVVRPTSIEVGESISVKDFAKLLCRDVNEVIKKLFLLGKMVTINQEIDHETAELVGMDFNCEIKEPPPEQDPTELPEVEDDPAKRKPRPPVVTVMGHVDHGKTSLLDAIRKTNVTAREAGGITQHIGAYRVICQGRPIVFLDTPGHEAFTAMRARGAQVTDIAVLVVAADDGVMPQTLEAINHAKAANVPVIVAINKIDKEGANPDFVMQQLSEHGLIPEAWGGDTIMVPVSARQKTGISDILEMILLEADMLELKANPDLPAHGTIIEAKLDKGRGPVATVLVDRGTLHIGDSILAGTTYGKVRAMVNDRGEKVKKAGPSTPVEVLGLNDVPEAGDFLDATDEHTARVVAEKRLDKQKMDEQKKAKVSLDDIFSRIQEGEMKDLNIVVKADVQGTIQALEQALTNIKNTEVKVVIVHSGVGTINESDVMLASASNALIIGFNVRPDANARKAAETEQVDIRTYRVIYDALNDVEAAIKGMLAPKFREKIIGHVEIRKVIPINKNLIAGVYVKDGKITRNAKIRLVRDGIIVHEGELDSLRRFKDDVKEVAASYECGLTLADYRDIKEGDQLEVYIMEEVAAD